MKKLYQWLASALVLALLLTPMAMAADTAAEDAALADALKSMGLFLGTDAGYELDRAPTRAEALVIQIRLMGKEAEAKAYVGDCPLEDVKGLWMAPYVGWAYAQGITTGTTETAFDPTATANAKMFVTFVLRAMGYGADFLYDDALTKASELGLTAAGSYDAGAFLRGDCVRISDAALKLCPKGSEDTLIRKLVNDGAVTQESAEALGLVAPDASIQKTVACVGDSLTFGLMADDPATQSYPAVMAKLRGDYRFVTENYGLSGACVDPDDSYFFALPYDASEQFAASMKTEAEIVLLMLGTNDAFWSPNTAQFRDNYQAMLNHYIELPQKPLVVAVLPPHTYLEMMGTNYDDKLIPLVEEEKAVAAALGVPVIDANSFTADAPELFSDNIHFTVDGYAQLAGQVYTQLCAILDAAD